MTNFTKQAQLQSLIAFSSRSQYTNLESHGNGTIKQFKTKMHKLEH